SWRVFWNITLIGVFPGGNVGGPGLTGGMNTPVELLGQVVADLDVVLRSDVVAGLSDDVKMDLLRVAGQVQRRVEAVVVETVASVDARPAGSGELGFCGMFGCRSMGELLQRVLRTDAAGAGRVVKVAKAVRREVGLSSGGWLPARWPALRGALVEGTVGVVGVLAAIGPVEQAGARVGTGDRLLADAELAAYARGIPVADLNADSPGSAGVEGDVAPSATPEDLRILAQVIVQYLDPDGAEPADDIAMRARGIVLGRVKDGVIPIRGGLLPEVAGQLQRIFDAYLNPKVDGPPLPGVMFRPSDDTDADPAGPADNTDPTGTDDGADPGVFSGNTDPTGTDDGADTGVFSGNTDPTGMGDGVLPSGDPGRVVDPRSRAQKQHDTLAAVLGIAARHDDMPKLGGAAPTLVVAVTADDYTTGRGWAHVEGVDTPVPARVAAHTACAGGVQRVLFDPAGRIIGIHTSDRVFNVHQRRAITLRDKECLIPGCHVPATWCEIHHVQEHAYGGPTHTDNGATLCWHHHRTLTTSGWEIRMHNNVPHVRGPAWWDPTRQWRTPQPPAPRSTA
ncbi:HNH endonuclease signature motif containing protein, partial [Microbacterium sp. MYb62]|uniref:HNH endonuclease signature motif containing protein n=1 Tax=Microbacterium sp. MYb62 TaxID=1848690 RepID=UPI0011B079BF